MGTVPRMEVYERRAEQERVVFLCKMRLARASPALYVSAIQPHTLTLA